VQRSTGLDVKPHDFRRTVGTRIANATSIKDVTAQLGHTSETTTRMSYVKRNRLAPDLRIVIDQLVVKASEDLLAGGAQEGKDE
jgi:integrase